MESVIEFTDIMELTDDELDMKKRLSNRIVYIDTLFKSEDNYNKILNDIILEARFKALSRIYPFDDYSQKPLPKKYYDWQYRCCIEIYNLADKQGFSTYSENGWSFGKITDGISEQLLLELMPNVGVPKKKEKL